MAGIDRRKMLKSLGGISLAKRLLKLNLKAIIRKLKQSEKAPM